MGFDSDARLNDNMGARGTFGRFDPPVLLSVFRAGPFTSVVFRSGSLVSFR